MGSKVGSCCKTVWLGEQRNNGQQMGLGSLMGSEEGDHYLDSQLASGRTDQVSHFPLTADSMLVWNPQKYWLINARETVEEH